MPESESNPFRPPESTVGTGFIMVQPLPPPWRTILFRPRSTIRRLLDARRYSAMIPLAINLGVAFSLSRAIEKHSSGSKSAVRFLVEVLGGGAVGGIVGVYLLGVLLWLSGRWIGGRGRQLEIRTAIAWASMPYVPVVLLQLLALLFFGLRLYLKANPYEMSREEGVFFLVVGIGYVIAHVWAMVLWIKCVAEAHRFSWIRSFIAWFLAYLTAVGFGLLTVGVARLIRF